MNQSLLFDDLEVAHDAVPALARQCLYRFAALALLDPRRGAWEQLNSLRHNEVLFDAAALVREQAATPPGGLARGERPLTDLDPEKVLAKLPSTADALNAEYEAVFGLLVSSDCPPYETEYISSKFTFQRSNGLADIAGFYRAFGLDPSPHCPERHDHIVLELEFMAHVSGLLHQAEEIHDASHAERVDICLQAQRRFLDEHLAWWSPAFAMLLARRAKGTFYEGAAHCLSAFIPAERALLRVDTRSQPSPPSKIERPEECEGCAVAIA
jgi:putative dimethyl sulfoxide reductase chaperone